MRDVCRPACASALSVMAGLSAFGCSGASQMSPTSPANSRFTIAGRVTVLQNGGAAAGVGVSATSPTQGTVTGTADSNGAYSLLVPAVVTLWHLSFDGTGYLQRVVPYQSAPQGAPASTTVISLAAPFSLDFYREFVRGARDNTALQPLARWTVAPKFFFMTAASDTGAPVPDAVIDVMQQMATRETPVLTGGQFQPAQFARGSTPPNPATGWIVVQSYANGIPGSPGAGGTSPVGANPGSIRLLLDLTPVKSCQYLMAGAFYHEIVHALGYWHTSEGFSVDNLCDTLLADLSSHAQIAYSRPVGNRDPDVDPDANGSVTAQVVR